MNYLRKDKWDLIIMLLLTVVYSVKISGQNYKMGEHLQYKMKATANENIYNDAWRDTLIIGKVKSGDSILVIGKERIKYFIQKGSLKGYIYGKCLYSSKEFNGKKNLLKSFFDSIYSAKRDSIKLAKFNHEKLIKESLIRNRKLSDSLRFVYERTECQYKENGKDQFEGTKRIITEFQYVSNLLRIQLRKIGNSKTIIFNYTGDLGCVSSYKANRSTVKVKLKNGKIVTFYHFNYTDCGNFELWGKLTPKDILNLKQSPIIAIRLTGTKYFDDIKFEDLEDFPEYFQNKLKCID